jgi:hypothetical protein
MAIIVHFIKHWDNDTKGTIEVKADSLVDGIDYACEILLSDIKEDDVVLGHDQDVNTLFTITKAEIAQGSNWTGAPSAAF